MPITDMGRELQLDAISSAPIAGPCTVMLVRSGHLFSASLSYLDEVTADEVTATGYARQVATFGAVSILGSGVSQVTIDDTLFGLLGGAVNDTVAGCYLFADSGDPATSPLIACLPFETEIPTDGSAMTIRWPFNTMQAASP